MAEKILTSAKIYVDGADLSGDHTQIALSANVELLDKTNLASSARERVAGLPDIEFTGQGWYNPASGKADPTLWASLGSTMVVTVVPPAVAVGSVAFLAKGVNGGYNPFAGASVGQIAPFDFKMQGIGKAIVRGKLISRSTALHASSNGTAVNIGAVSSTQTLYATLHTHHVSSSGSAGHSLKVTIQTASSSGFTSPSTKIIWTASTATRGRFSSLSSANTDTWMRAVKTITGTSATFAVAVSVGIR